MCQELFFLRLRIVYHNFHCNLLRFYVCIKAL